MKTYLTKSKSSFLILATLLALPLWAKPVAQVTEITGQVFMVTPDGNTKSLKMNDHLDEKSEVMVEEGASVTLIDYYDATYHLIGGSHLKFFNKSVQLKRGKTWIQSQNARHGLALTTANGHVNFWKAEFITTFDQASSRSQILVVNGDAEISNVLDKNMKYSIPAGSFTLVDPEVENGIPRSPTKVGLASLNSALAEFKRLPGKMKEANTPARTIASVPEKESAKEVKKGEIIFISSSNKSVKESAHAYFKKTAMSKKKSPTVSSPLLTIAPIKFYGMPNEQNEALRDAPRSPASVAVVETPVQNVSEKVIFDQEFSDSLKKHELKQPKYANDLESLIMDLKSY